MKKLSHDVSGDYKPVIAVYGGINIDLVMNCKTIPKLGETVKAEAFNQYPGGKGANQAVAAAKSGGNVKMIGAVGSDGFGEKLIEGMLDNNIDVSKVCRITDVPTGSAMILINGEGQNIITFFGGANDSTNKSVIDVAESTFRKADIFLLQAECPLEIVEYAIEKAYSMKTPIVFNPAPVLPFSRKIFSKCEIILPNENEAEALSGIKVVDAKSAHNAAVDIEHKGCGTVIITLGEKGAYIYKRGEYDDIIPAPKVEAVDTVAAGDVFVGAFSVRFGMGDSIEDAVIYANKAASISTTRRGAQTSIPDYSELIC